MNRIIKFRAWDIKNKEFPFIGFHIIGECTAFDLINQYQLKALNDLVITQFTGILDKNEKEIYESDIIQYSFKMYDHADAETHIGEVYYDSDVAAFLFDRLLNWSFMDGPIIKNSIEILGNVFENPKLL